MPQRHRMRSTTLAAGDAVRGSHSAAQESEVLAYIRRRGNSGATRDEIHVATGIPLQSVCFRVRSLIGKQEVRETTVTRATRTGSDAFVLVADGYRAQLPLF